MLRITIFALLCVPQFVLKFFELKGSPLSHDPLTTTVAAGLAIVASATMLAWASELAEADIPQGLALAFVALVAVLPEYTVDLYFAWQAGKDPTYTHYAVANMTGANRLLIGVGWSAIAFLYWLRSKNKGFSIDATQIPAIWALIVATLFSFIFPLRGSIGVLGGLVLLAIFVLYIRKSAAVESEEKLAEPFIKEMLQVLSVKSRRALAIGLFLFCSLAILASAESFAEGLINLGRHFNISEFLLVQWLAPLASESPELLVALLFAWRLHPKAGLSTLISSKVNQWTLLVGMLPLVYAFSSGWKAFALPLDARQTEEVFLTSAQSLFATVLFSNFHFSLQEALILFVLFAGQLILPFTGVRWAFAIVYIILSVVWLAASRQTRQNLKSIFFTTRNAARGTHDD